MKITGNRLVDNGDSITVVQESYHFIGMLVGISIGFLIVIYTSFTELIINSLDLSNDIMVDFLLITTTALFGILLSKGKRERDILKIRVIKITRKYGEVSVVISAQDPSYYSAL